ncbi:nucleotidyl cyclase domain-containing protein [Govanella unica]|uniref:EAL domain-containing protein n=1 Tax=Govanella unica TaxID=2975056 RepID=A0A9X3Z7L2_9PROT|nr:hypothetical protein [Govania unica]MDA5194104.1 hypothetical protein [Govania unica]
MSAERLLDLDEESRERLRLLLADGGAVSAGQLVLFGLEAVKSRLGESWPRYVDRVHEQTTKILTQVLDPSEVFLRLGEDRYVIVFCNRDQAVAQVICEKIVRDVAEVFLGTPEMMELTADGVVMMLNADSVAQILGLEVEDAEPRDLSIWQDVPPVEMAVRGPEFVTVADGAVAPLGDICFVPIWDMARNVVYTYKPSILAVRGRRRVSGYHALEDGRDARAVRMLDFALLQAAGRAIEAGTAGAVAIMTIPVSFRTLASRDAALDYFGDCAALPAHVRRHIIFELADLTPGTPVWRAYELLSTLKRFSRGLFLRIDQSWRDFSILQELPVRGLVFDVEMDMRPLDRIAADMARAAVEARGRGWVFAVSGVYNRELTLAARAAGARLVYGHYLVAAVSKPLPAKALDWMALEKLTGGDGSWRAVQMERLV